MLVVGLGVSGQSVCELLLGNGDRVTATDARTREAFAGALDSLEKKGCVLHLGGHVEEDFLSADCIVVSPGVPLDLPPLARARSAGVEIIGELECAWRFFDGKATVIAVTGTNGKTTTTSLLGEMFQAAGRRVFVGGNIGTPLSRWLLSGKAVDALILEVSSFQLDTAPTFRPDVGVLLNVTEDHLDRYADFAAYADSKFSIFARPRSGDTAIVNGDDPICRERQGEVPSHLLVYSRFSGETPGRMKGGLAEIAVPGREPFTVDLAGTTLHGAHNEENVLASALAATACGIPPEAVREGARRYHILPHRVEWAGVRNCVDFYDDSKATNVGALVKALENFDRPVLLLMGGRDKLGDYGPLEEPLRRIGKGVFVFGEGAGRLRSAIAGWTPTHRFETLDGAFSAAVEAAEPGDVVLLSPACSSFDQYSSYAERGDHFKRLVSGLPE
jgi:UDP-N-acetylmuramoylalanine--D-glutamate ligase